MDSSRSCSLSPLTFSIVSTHTIAISPRAIFNTQLTTALSLSTVAPSTHSTTDTTYLMTASENNSSVWGVVRTLDWDKGHVNNEVCTYCLVAIFVNNGQ